VNAMKERQAWCCLQVILCDPFLIAFCALGAKRRYINRPTLPFLSVYFASAYRIAQVIITLTMTLKVISAIGNLSES